MKIANLLCMLLILILSIGGTATDSLASVCGDANANGIVNIADVTFLINFLYKSGPAPNSYKAADVDNSDLVNIKDITYLINSLYKGGPAPTCSKYLGQVPPDSIPEVFAPGIVSKTGYIEFSSTFDPAFTEFYFTRRGGELLGNTIFVTSKTGSAWSEPSIASFATTYRTVEPSITPDGMILLFGSEQPCGYCQAAVSINIWHLDKTESGWSEIQPPEEPFCLLPTMNPTASLNGNIYFTHATQAAIYISQFEGGTYQTPVRLSSAINKGYSAHSYIAPDESYMIFDAENRPDAIGGSDLFISFRRPDDSWTESLNLGSVINTLSYEFCPNASPDGKYLFFSRVLSDDEFEIYWCDTKFIDKMRLGIQKIFFSTDRYGAGEICSLNPDGTGFRRLTTNSYHDNTPATCPDGTRLAFSSVRGGKYELYLMNYDGANQQSLTLSSYNSTHPDWSPDGTKIAFARFWNTTWDSSDIFIIDVASGVETQITNGPGVNMCPDWYPDGSKLLFTVKRGDHYQLYSMNADGSNEQAITNADTNHVFGQISPDGAKIVYAMGTANSMPQYAEIHVMNADGTGDIAITNNTIVSEDPCWSPDGSEIVFQSSRSGIFRLYIMNADGSNVRLLPGNGDFWPRWGVIGAAPPVQDSSLTFK